MSRQLTIYCIIFAIFITLATFIPGHLENDEQVYLTLAKRITCTHSGCFIFDFKRYNLLGTSVLSSLVEPEYHQTSFFHPPAFLMVLSLANRIGGETGMQMVPIFIYILIAFTIYKLLLLLELSKKTVEIGILLSLCSSSLLFNTQKIWMDLFMACMLIISFYFLLRFVKQKNTTSIVLSGLFFFFAVFTKYWALAFYIPFVFFLIFHLRRKSFIPFLLFSFPLLFLGINTIFHIIPISSHPLINGTLRQGIIVKHSPYPFIEYVTHRPFFYYFYSLFLINPAYLYVIYVARNAFRKIMNERSFLHSTTIFLLCFILYSFLLFSVLALLGGGFQTRYVVFAEPFIILLMCMLIEKTRKKEYPFLFVFLIHNVVLVLMNTVFFNSAELFPFIEMLNKF